ncbi:hypothetical protein GCM10007205_14560 [Oxalicibacterium flavum]|uniref:NarX-like N-terminal domain-containing protein n=1 Tax=Oxalicibacterium flavum TaxID=179467 RepID=A0A8J2XXW3_9BURK|nr:type IV pili methyl-accepting chemotaxis transducer N-terminal domain-containing protein [Oxalicibacterium flavum]GGC06469.1 hypothetical protein GCM10007205_14560 [Oxalicibacterium flavum]
MDRRCFIHAAAAAGTCLLAGRPAHAQIVRIHDAINQSGRQRMLSQRMAKSYLQVGQDIDRARSNRIFADSIALFERQLKNLQGFAPNAENRGTLAELDTVWQRYRQTLTAASPNAGDARQVMALSDEVLALAHASTLQLEALSATESGHLVNIAGRQRMLSQRMAKFYQAVNWGVAPAGALDALATARREFLAAMQELEAAPVNTRALLAELELARQQWFFFDQALRTAAATADSRRRFATNVATTSERILETMDRITGMYEQAA